MALTEYNYLVIINISDKNYLTCDCLHLSTKNIITQEYYKHREEHSVSFSIYLYS